MKKIILILTSVFLMGKITAQDIIYKNDGTEIQSKVVEITSEVIKYKNFSQPNGPIRNILIRDVFMIIYQDGTKEVLKGKNDDLKEPVEDQNTDRTVQRDISGPGNQETTNSKASNQPPKIEHKKEAAFFVKGGFSPIMGYAGGEYFYKLISVDAGAGILSAPTNNETRTTIGLGFTLYVKEWYESSPYLSFGFSVDGAVQEDGMTIYGTYNNHWTNLYSFLAGYRLNIAEILDLKAGIGYCWSDFTRGFAFEGTLGIKLFSHYTKE